MRLVRAHGVSSRTTRGSSGSRRAPACARARRFRSALRSGDYIAPVSADGALSYSRRAVRYHAIVIGGGHNGLTAAAYLARAGRRVLVLERRHVLGGAAVTEEVFPGFRFSVCSYVVSLLRPQIIRELDLREARPRDSSARRHFHADAGRRLPVACERSREDAARDRPAFEARRRGVRRIRQGHGRDGALRQAAARRRHRPIRCRGTRASCCGWRPSAGGFVRSAGPRSLQPAAVDDDERHGFSRPVVRDRRAQGHDVGVGHHRHVPRRAVARHRLRPAPPLHGRDRRRVPILGLRARRHRRDLERHRRCGPGSRRRDPDRCARGAHPDQVRRGHWRSAGQR